MRFGYQPGSEMASSVHRLSVGLRGVCTRNYALCGARRVAVWSTARGRQASDSAEDSGASDDHKTEVFQVPSRPHPTVDRAIRVNHAGEFGADRIYAGQAAVLGNSSVGPVIKVGP